MAKRGGCLKRIFVLGLLVAVLLGGAVAAYWYLGPFKGYADEKFIEIDRGSSSRAIAQLLEEEGVIRSHWAFLAIRALNPRTKLQAGEYRFASEVTPWAAFEKLKQGAVFYEDLTVPEGSNIFDIAALLEKADTVDSKDFLKVAQVPDRIRDLDPQAPTLEGYLFPSTYRLTHQTTGGQLCELMITEFRKQWIAAGGGARVADTHRLVTLASLIEKETAVPQERPMIAAIFENRLRVNMPLQCDPTTVYAALVENRYRGTIYKSDLASANPYNTYAHPGLPPGPIANAGLASLKAALHPAANDYLYFVAKPGGAGSHQFSSTLSEHEKAVEAYRKAPH